MAMANRRGNISFNGQNSHNNLQNMLKRREEVYYSRDPSAIIWITHLPN